VSAPDTTHDLPLLLRLLVERGKLSEDQLEQIEKLLAQRPESLEVALIAEEFTTDQLIAETYASFLRVPWLEKTVPAEDETMLLEHEPGDGLVRKVGTVEDVIGACKAAAEALSEGVCRHHRLVPYRDDESTLDVACVNPADFGALEEARVRTGRVVRPIAVPLGLLEELLDGVFGARDVVREIASEARGPTAAAEAEGDEEMEFVLDLQRPIPAGKDSQVVRIVNVLLGRAIEEGASDIHIEPYEDTVRVRYRVDGKLRETTSPPRSLFVPTVSRLKILAKMDIAEKRIPQDGAIALKTGERRVDLRVSTVPTVFGEKMVIRVLAKEGIPEKMEQLGFTPKQATDFLAAANSPHGLMFVTGPTGSGKSTTLYTCLKLINSPHENILTVEDPVEYKFQGLNQVHVKAAVGLTFAAALRSFLRQDPDKIMVGEVRDQETAQICMRAALTGHLVLSTLHTNNSLQVINRLVDMGVEPFLLGPTLRLLEAQRLVRKLCPDCKESYELPADVAQRHGLKAGMTLYRVNKEGCQTCRGKGARGRVGLYEVLPVTIALRDAICRRAPVAELEKLAREGGAEFLDDAARRRLTEGVTSLEEVAEFIRLAT
jgi:type IV pilus assembly protein PilB